MNSLHVARCPSFLTWCDAAGYVLFQIVDNFTYVICGDGCLQEGVSAEACSLGGHLGLGRLIVLYDDNSVRLTCIRRALRCVFLLFV